MNRVLVLLWLLWASLAQAQESVRVVVGLLADYTNKADEAGGIAAFQGALRKLKGVGVEAHGTWLARVGELGLEAALPNDPYAVVDATAAVDVDAVLYLKLQPKGRDADLVVQVYAGRSGQMLGEHVIKVKKGKPTKATWTQAARSIEADIYATLDAQAPPPRRRKPDPEPMPEIPVDPEPRRRGDNDEDEDENPGDFKMFRLQAGLSLLARTFDYKATADSPQFSDGGIQYESAMVPGIALEAEIHPLRSLQGLGFSLRYEKVFVSTEQEVQLNDGRTKTQPLDTSHNHILVRALYRHRFSQSPSAIELVGGLGFGLLSFAVAENDEYNGVSYRYLDVTAGGYVPFGTPLAALDVQFSLLPVVSLGDTVEELGEQASTTGWRVYAGMASLFGAFSASGGLEYTSMSSAITGAGRGGRKGKTADDSFLGLRLMGGYRF
jgi:hypothetical protein